MRYFWHIHHDTLLGWSDNIQERADFIKAEKPMHEVETRLRLLRPVQGAIPPRLVKARAVYERAVAAYERAVDVYEKARAVYEKARAVYDRVYNDCLPQIEALHAVECPDCPWNGKTIFEES